MNRSTQKYYNNIKLLLPYFGKDEKILLNSIKLRLKELNFTDSETTYDEICKKLGSPQEIVSEYIINYETDKLIKRLNISSYVQKFIAFLVAVCLILSVVKVIYLNKAFKEVQRTTIAYEETVIK